MIIFSSLGSKINNIPDLDEFAIDMQFIDQDGINSIIHYYEQYGEQIIEHIPNKYIEDFETLKQAKEKQK